MPGDARRGLRRAGCSARGAAVAARAGRAPRSAATSRGDGPPPERGSASAASRRVDGRDMTPARRHARRAGRLAARGRGRAVALHAARGATRAGRTSTSDDTGYARRAPTATATSREAARRARGGAELPGERPGADHQAAGVDVGGAALLLVRRDRGGLVVRRARLRPRRRRALGARSRARSRSARSRPSPPLLILDLGRPERFLQHAADLQAALADVDGRVGLTRVRRPRRAARSAPTCSGARRAAQRARRAPTRVVGGYLGSYTGVLLASTAVPVWAAAARFLGPIFVSTATATGGGDAPGARRHGLAPGPPDAPRARRRRDRRDGRRARAVDRQRAPPRAPGEALEEGRPGRLSRRRGRSSAAGLALRLARAPRRARAPTTALSASSSPPALASASRWVGAGRPSARDDEVVAQPARRPQASARPA